MRRSQYPYPKNVVLDDPYGSGHKVALLQAIKADISVVRVPFADMHGNGTILGASIMISGAEVTAGTLFWWLTILWILP